MGNAVLVAKLGVFYALIFSLAEGLITSENGIAELFVEILCDRQSVLRIVAGLRLLGRHGNERLVFAARHHLNVLYHKTAVYCDLSRSFEIVVIHGS